MTTANVGPGILQKMDELGDHPITPSSYKHYTGGGKGPYPDPAPAGFSTEEAWGTQGLYIASNMTGQWEVSGPFGSGSGVAPAPTLTLKIEPRLVSVNYNPGRATPVNAIVIHSMTDVPDNDIEAVARYFNNPDAEVSAHFGVSTGGKILQFVRLEDTAWANGIKKAGNSWLWPGNPNPRTVSIETEGGPNDEVSAAMFDAVQHCCLTALARYPGITHLYAHNSIANTQCPGPRWTGGKIQALGIMLGLSVIA